MHCEDCLLATPRPPHWWQRFNPACLDCGARYLWCIQRLALQQDEKRDWLRKTLDLWKSFGHPERALRDGAKRSSAEWKEWARDIERGTRD